MAKPKVYIVSRGSHDYSVAAEHGDIVYLFEDKANVFASDKLVKTIEERLAGSTPDDYLILSGSMLPSSVAWHVMMRKHGLVNNLIFSFKNENYERRTIRGTQFA